MSKLVTAEERALIAAIDAAVMRFRRQRDEGFERASLPLEPREACGPNSSWERSRRRD